MQKHFPAFMRAESGASLAELALVTPFLLLLLLGAIDLGRAYFTATEVAGAAHAGAIYGSTSPTDTTGMQAAATSDAPDISNLTVATPTYGCECSDGTGFSASCSSTPACVNNVVYRVSVTASATYKPWFPWPGVPSTITLSRTAVMRGSGS